MKTYNNFFEKKVFAVWKPSGISSNKFIQKVKKKFGFRKIGHGGTLDPLASGILIVGVNEGTKELDSIKKLEKEYIAVIKLGEKSFTDDAEGPIEKVEVKEIPKKSDIDKTIKNISNITEQIPPLFSAVKVNGREAYKLTRKGIIPKLKSKKVKIYSIKVLSYKWPILKIKLIVGGGFYVRALARDIGEKLKTGAYLLKLTRTAVGSFKKKDCIKTTDDML